MIKILAIIIKNFKLIVRSKSSIVILMLAPILLMIIIGLSLNTQTTQRINIGYVFSDDLNNSLSMSFIDELKKEDFFLQQYDDIYECKKKIIVDEIHLCILFPLDFKIEDNKINEIDFYVDNSKINYFSMVLDSIETKFNEKALELSTGLTKQVLDKLNQTTTTIENKSEIVELLKYENQEILKGLNQAKDNINLINTDFDKSDIDINKIQDFDKIIFDLKRNTEDAIEDTERLIKDIEYFVDDTNLTLSDKDDILEILDRSTMRVVNLKSNINETTFDVDLEFLELIEDLEKDVLKIENKLDSSTAFKEKSLLNIDELKEKILLTLNKINFIDETFKLIINNIESTQVKSLDSIVKPIKKNINPISKEDSQLNFYFPYLIVLVIMFIGVLLASTLVNIEKNSKAYFRNFVTPTSDFTFLISKYLTTIFIISIQVLVLLLIYIFYFEKDIFNNLSLIILILFLAATVFSLIGILIGNIFNSNETSMLASVFVCSLMLFISDLIFPLERIPKYIADFAQLINPFYIFSELLRKSMVHNLEIYNMGYELTIIFLSILLLFILSLLFHLLSKKHFILRVSGYIARRDVKRKILLDEKSELKNKLNNLNEKNYFVTLDNFKIKNIDELIAFIEKLDKIEFKKYVNNDQNLFADWFIKIIKFDLVGLKLYKTKKKYKVLKILNKLKKQIYK
ncbi:MAG: ABC transporter permease [Candidatus Woesearchaeota archaeon]